MTTTTETRTTPSSSPATTDGPSGRRRAGRAGLVGLLIASLLATAGARYLSDNRRYAVLTNNGAIPLPSARGTNLGGMNSFALALLLGGLRGPLVMILWQQSEAQKAEKNLEGVDTQIEWIRMLQPEFDSVHIFQVWNKAYNISVQMASLPNKYITIVDALQYAFSVNEERPHNINILASLAHTFFDKLGNSQEKDYYRQRVREDSKWRNIPQAQANRETIRHTRLEPRLDQQGNLLPAYLGEAAVEGEVNTAVLPKPADWPADQPWRGGADLQYLERYQPFTYGISPFAFAYNYHRHAQYLQNHMGLRHAQLSTSVIDSRPALALKNWAEEEWERGRRLEAQILGGRTYSDQAELERLRPWGDDMPEPRHQLELITTPFRPAATPLQHANVPEMLFSYERAARLAADAVAEYQRHLADPEYSLNITTYQSHLDHLNIAHQMLTGDRYYIEGMTHPANSPERRAAFERATAAYRETLNQSQVMMLKYFVDPSVLARLGGNRDQLRDLPPAQLAGLANRAMQFLAQNKQMDVHFEDRLDYVRYANRARQRLEFMEQQ